MKRNLRPFDGIHPQLPESCFVDDTALIIGDAVLGEDCSVWPMAVIRADVNSVRIGARSNVQDFCMLHESHKNDKDPNGAPLTIGEDVTIGHHVNLHGCTIGDRVLVGMGTIVLDKAVVAQLASIPGREQLLAMLLGIMQAPVSGFARALAALAEKQAGGAEAPAEEAAA